VKPRKILVADLLCGAGGSSTGCGRALAEMGLEMELVCVNHWGVAIDTHKRNHPDARHFCQDISTVRPHIIVPEGYLDLLMASPSCTHHSVARGGKPTSDQQRSDPWHIVTWLTELRVKRLIIENVREFVHWGPVDPRTGKPIKSRKGEYFRAWIDTIRRLGFDPEWRSLNAADYGDATTRQRFILMARSDGRTVSWPTPTHVKRDANLSLLPGVQSWKPARDIIDWSIKGKSIFNRKKDLAPKTMARIYAGAVKFNWPEPFLVILRNHMAGQSVDAPLPTVAANGLHIGLAEPVIMNGRKGNQAKPVSTDPIPTLDTKGGVWLAEPLVLSQHNSGAPRSADDPLPTITTGGAAAEDHPGCARPMLVEPFIMSRQSEGAPRTVDEPMPTQAAVHSPVLIAPYYGSGSGETCHTAEEPLPTVTAKARFSMVMPVTHSDGSDRARDAEESPLPTITTANRGELAFIAAQFGEREGQAPRIHDIKEPSPAITATGHVNLIEGKLSIAGYDILFRMLEPHELAAAMGFTSDEARYEFAGTKTDQIKQIGNAVSVAKMKACVGAIMADAAPKKRTKSEAERDAA
jgi:DNA (cytosine-5)-methyltransferase 1